MLIIWQGIKGREKYHSICYHFPLMVRIFRRLFGKPFTPLNLITISRNRLVNNYEQLSKVDPEIKIAPVLKSNAYGHGIRLVGEILDKVGAPFLCVDSLYEAFQLTKANVKTPILIMGYIHSRSLMVKKLPFSFAVYDLEHARVLNEYQKGAKLHVFIDTGMHREGVSMEELAVFFKKLKTFKNIEIEGLMSHLAEPSKPDSGLTKLQIHNFRKAKKMILEAGLNPKWFHLGGTYGLLNGLAHDCNLVRVGRAIYGIDEKYQGKNRNISKSLILDSNNSQLTLEPVLQHTTTIVQIKNIKKGDKVGYSGIFTASKNMTVGILPLGYNDGVDRRLSNKQSLPFANAKGKGVVTVGGVVCPIIGLVSMNITIIDLSGVKKPVLGAEAVIFSDNPGDENSVVNASKRGGILPHEMLIHIAESTKRVVV